MKIVCNVDIFNRLSTLAPSSGRRKPQRSCLAIGRQSVKTEEIYLLHQNQTNNKNGTKYKINNNIEQVFTKFVNEGKATIRLKEPPFDINIQCDAIQLKSFLHTLKLGFTKKLDPAVLNLSNLNPKKIIAANKTKITVKNTSEYPVLQGFPRTTEELTLSGLQRRSFDRQILKLQSLRILDLSENQLTNLPQELGKLPNLQELNLSNNQLGKSPMSKWSWMNSSNISKTLCLLNLSANQLTRLPDQINKLHSLFSLFLNNNSISKLPDGIGNLSRLKFLNLSKNSLTHLPGSISNLKLNELDISENPFNISNDNLQATCNIKVPSLVDLTGQVILKARIYYDASIIPFTLVHYLDKAHYCMCGTPCFDCFFRRFIPRNLSTITQSLKFSGAANNDILFDCYFCSVKCLRKHFKNF